MKHYVELLTKKLRQGCTFLFIVMSSLLSRSHCLDCLSIYSHYFLSSWSLDTSDSS